MNCPLWTEDVLHPLRLRKHFITSQSSPTCSITELKAEIRGSHWIVTARMWLFVSGRQHCECIDLCVCVCRLWICSVWSPQRLSVRRSGPDYELIRPGRWPSQVRQLHPTLPSDLWTCVPPFKTLLIVELCLPSDTVYLSFFLHFAHTVFLMRAGVTFNSSLTAEN